MKILFVSELCSKDKYDLIEKQKIVRNLGTQQKFFNSIVEGLTSINDIEVQCLSAPPVSSSSHKKKIWTENNEVLKNNKNLNYKYIGFYNGKILRFITIYFSIKRACKKWLCDNKKCCEKVIICDSLIAHCAIPVLKIAKKSNCKVIAITTDIPQFMYISGIKQHGNIRNILQKIYNNISLKYSNKFDGYVLLTEFMNKLVNCNQKPYLVIEGCVNSSKVASDDDIIKDIPMRLVYAGGIYEKYGVVKLANAFLKSNVTRVILDIYGTGDDVNIIKQISEKDNRIQYKGVVGFDEIFDIERRATLLINPRPSNEEFTKYSFPSKTTEYMSSGTPALSTKLPGIPAEYKNYIYWFEDESENGMKETIEKILNKNAKELYEFGIHAKQFILINKNKTIQTQKIIDFIRYKVLCNG